MVVRLLNASPPGTNGPKPVSGALVNSCAMHCSRRSKHSVRTRSAWGTDYGKRGIISAPVGKTLYKQEDYFIYYTGYFSADYAGADKSCQPVGIYQSAYISGKISVHGALQTGTDRISGLLQQPQNQSKTKGLAACNSQTTSPFGCLNNFYFKILSNFSGSLHCPNAGDILLLLQIFRHKLRQLLGQLGMALPGQVHEINGIELAEGGIQEMHA